MAVIPNKISHIASASIADPDNTTTANLGNGSTFTGEWTQVQVGSRLILTAYSDQDIVVKVQYSTDGVNVRSTLARYINTSQIEAPHIFINARRYFRVVIENNSGSATTALEVHSYIAQESGILNIPIDANMSQDYDSISVRPTGFESEIALNRRQGWTTWNKFGYNQDVDTGSQEVVASFGGTFSRMTSADTLSIVSSDANDTNGGTGVNSVIIYGIDENRDPVIAGPYNMNGTTPVVTTGQQFLGVNRVAVFLFGSGGTNAGTITVTATSAGSTQAEIPAGDGVTQQLIFHVPRSHTFLATWLRFNVNKLSGGGSPRVTLRGLVYSTVNQGTQEVWREVIDTTVENFIDVNPPEPFPVTESTILYFTAETNTNNTIVSGRFSGKLVRDVDA